MATSERTAIVVTGPEPLVPEVVAQLDPGGFVIAADGGYDRAITAGLDVDVLVGDMDSVSLLGLGRAQRTAQVLTHPRAKAVTDTELAIAEAVRRDATHVVVVAGGGDRLDHELALFGALGRAGLSGLRVEAWWGLDHLYVVNGPDHLVADIAAGVTFSLLTLHGPASGITLTGARWPLDDADLDAGVGRGVSNVAIDPPIELTVRDGVVTVVIPGAQP